MGQLDDFYWFFNKLEFFVPRINRSGRYLQSFIFFYMIILSYLLLLILHNTIICRFCLFFPLFLAFFKFFHLFCVAEVKNGLSLRIYSSSYHRISDTLDSHVPMLYTVIGGSGNNVSFIGKYV